MGKLSTRYVIRIDENYCTGCGNCISFCPLKVLGYSPLINRRGIKPPVVLDLDACSGCVLCEMYCGNFSIAVGKAYDDESQGRCQ